MVRRRWILLLVFILASISILFTTSVMKNAQFNSAYHHLITLSDFHARALKEFPNLTKTDKEEKTCSESTLVYGDYCVISLFRDETRNTSESGLLTLSTQGTVEFLKHVVVLCHRWSSPISVAVYTPQDDYGDAQIMVHLLRKCDSCIRYWVSWHFFYPKQTKLSAVDEFQLTENCSSITSAREHQQRRSQGIYPINVGRNLARQLSSTPFVFSIDIELYPSLNIPSKFERMLRSQPLKPNNQVWVLPVFEVHAKYRAPLLKSELREMYLKKVAISFHQYRCNICHKIPNLTQWMALGNKRSSEVEDSLEPLRVMATVKRSKKFKLQEWEPFFIGTKKDPEFDIRLSWEGKQNKMQVAYEMCMKNYDFHIIENAFLVHSPGINVYNANASKEKERSKYALENQKVITEVKTKLKKKYGSRNSC